MKIHEIFDRDPLTTRLANNGQARIVDHPDEKALQELRAELESFVCDGQFGDALQRILDGYLQQLDRSRQKSAWVSGFFGSGKSHLLKMLAHLWVNTEFPDGASARSLVPGGLPDDVEASLRELDVQANRIQKRPVAAAGTLLGGSVDHVRHTILSIVLRACGLPPEYVQASFCFWLSEKGCLEPVRQAVEAAGKHWLRELNHLYVSPVIAEALRKADPDLAPDVHGVRKLLVEQFPQRKTDITTEEFIAAARKALAPDGQLPLTLLVLDEVQQYINEAQDRAGAITELAEAIQTQFDSRVMLVGAGQSALSAGTPALQWLRDRFEITVELSDADVEAVTRKVLLQKRPSVVPQLERLLDAHSGEVDRHLAGSRIGPRAEDRQDRVPDYPLLCTRRRFWEKCFQAVDAAGTHSQLRSQLRIVHDSLRKVAPADVGGVIPASDLFDALAGDLVNTGVLLNEIHTRIRKLDDGTEEGRLRHDLCGLVFLVGKLPREEGVDLGLRAAATTLADLLVADITQDSGPFRKRVAETLEALASEGVLMRVGDEYRLQTTEGAEWDRAFRERRAALRQDEGELARRRDQLFGALVQEILGSVRLTHGESRQRRTLRLHTGLEPPSESGEAIVVWLRDGWSIGEKEVLAEARRRGMEDSTLYVHIPRKSTELLHDRIIDAEAARQVLDHYGIPSSPEGREAREGMESRRVGAESARDELVRDLVRAAKVFQGGGAEVFGEGLAEKLEAAASASLARLFPRFAEGDHKAWDAAVRRAKDGSDQPLQVVGWEGPTEDHPVAKEVLAGIGTAARGTDVHRRLEGPPFGWPRDAIDAALIALHRSGHLRATRNGRPVAIGALDQAGIKAAEFRPEKVRLSTSQRIELRALFEEMGVTTRSGEEEQGAVEFLAGLTRLAAAAGGPPPLPAPPDTRLVQELRRLAGSEQLGAIHQHREALAALVDEWKRLSSRAEERRSEWDLARSLLRHADRLAVADEVRPELEAIEAQRSLLGESDPLAPLIAKLASGLRRSLRERHAALSAEIERARANLELDPTWARLDEAARAEILARVELAPPPLDVGSDEALLRALEARPLGTFAAEIDAVAARAARALALAAERLDPDDPARPAQTVAIRRGTLADEAAVRAWLEEHERRLLEAVREGPVIVE